MHLALQTYAFEMRIAFTHDAHRIQTLCLQDAHRHSHVMHIAFHIYVLEMRIAFTHDARRIPNLCFQYEAHDVHRIQQL